MKVLLFDIETTPNVTYAWRPNQRFIPKEMHVRPGYMLGWAARWHGQRHTSSMFLDGPHARKGEDAKVVAGLLEMVSKADAIVAHNLKGFDLPYLRSRCIYHGFDPVPPVTLIDTLELSRKTFNLPYHNLDYLATYLEVDAKKHKVDFDLWIGCMEGDGAAIAKMKRYCRQDVLVLERVYDRLFPHIRNLPRLADAQHDNQMACPYCSSSNMQKRGVRRTNVSTFQRWQCNDCRRYSRSRKSNPDKLGVAPT